MRQIDPNNPNKALVAPSRRDTNRKGLPRLSLKDQRFVDQLFLEPDKHPEEVYAALNPGTKLANSRRGANKTLNKPQVKAYYVQKQMALTRMNNKTANAVADELVKVGYSRLTDIMSWDEEGNIRFNPSGELTDEQIAAIASVKVTQTTRSFKGESVVTRRFEVKMHDKIAALKALLRHATPKESKVKVTQNVLILPPEVPVEKALEKLKVYDVKD